MQSKTNNQPSRETNLDDVMQISNVFINVSKGEVAKSDDLQKAFGTTKVNDIVKEVRGYSPSFRTYLRCLAPHFFRSSRKEKCKWARKNGIEI